MRALPLMLALLTVLAPSPAARGDDDGRLAMRRTPVVEVFERCRDAVVSISATEIVRVRTRFSGIDRMFEEFFDLPSQPREREFRRTGVGSGFVLHPEGYIVTNAHVVAGTAERRVTFADGSEYDAKVVAVDRSSDVAMLKIDAPSPLPVLPLGGSEDLMIGETVIAIGNPLGYQHTVTAGVVSAVGRDLDFSPEHQLRGLIQTDASINRGNSGGPLLNVLGELIGVNTAIRGDAQNIGFAIPVDQLREALPALLDVERRYRIKTGLRLSTNGAPHVVAIERDSPAEAAGLEVGDVVVSVDGRPVTETVDFHIALIGQRSGNRVPIEVERSGRGLRTTLALAEPPAPDGRRLAADRLGLVVDAIPREVAERVRIPPDAGLYVVDVDRAGPAGQLGFQPGDVLQQVSGRSVENVDELGQVLEYVRRGDPLEVSVLRRESGRLWRLQGVLRAR